MKVKFKKFLFLVLTVITFALCGLLTACGEPDIVDVASITYDGAVITWDQVEDADGYAVQVNGTSETKVKTNAYPFRALATEERVDVTITAYNGDKAGEAVTKTFNRLPTIALDTITFDENGKMSWQAVAGASEYIVEVNGKTTKTPYLEFTDFVKGQRNQIRIKAAAESCFADWSETMAKDYLAAPTNIKYDGQFISWSGYTTAAKYNVIINGAVVNAITETTYIYDAQNTSFDLQVQSVGDGVNSFHSTPSDKVRYVFLKDVTGIKAQDGNLVWDAVEEATGYSVKLNGVEHQVETNLFDKLPANKDNIVSIKPLTAEGTTYFANWSAEQTVRVLVAPELKWNDGLDLDGQIANSLFWDKVDGEVGGYNVKVVSPDGTEEIKEVSPDTIQYGNAYLEVGEYKVSVQTYAVAGSNSYPSKFSPEVRIIRLPAPSAATQNFITSNPSDVKDGFTINWQAVSGASGYQLAKDGDLLDGTVTTTTKNIPYTNIMTEDETEAQVFNYTIQSIGSTKTFKTQRYVTLNSLSANNLKATVNVLAQPQNLDIEGYLAKWDQVPSATGYSITCNQTTSTSTTEYDLYNLEAGRYDNFAVCAKGNGGDLLASNYTPAIRLIRLAAPFDIRLNPQSGGDKLDWSGRNNDADHYEVYWDDGSLLSANAETIDNMGEYITTQASGVFMRAAANYWNDEEVKDIYYITSKPSQTVQFTKIAEPTFNQVVVNGNKLVWNAPANVTGVALKYRVTDARGVAQPIVVNACEYDISTLEAGEYSFRIQAIGDGKNWVTSEISADVAEFEKLATPEVEIEAGSAQYTWAAVRGEVVQYVVVVDGKIAAEIAPVDGQSEYSFMPKFTEMNLAGYDVQIYAKGNNLNEGTVDSTPYKHTAVAKKASKPGFKVEYCNENGEVIQYNESNAFIRVTVSAPSNYTLGYEVEAGGTSAYIKDGETVYEYKPGQAVDTTISVYANGGVFDEAGVFYVKSDSNAAQKITVLIPPANLEPFSGYVSWGAVTGTTKYEVEIYNGSELIWSGKVSGTTKKYLDDIADELGLDSLTSDDITEFRVRAVGNGTTVIGSDWATCSF